MPKVIYASGADSNMFYAIKVPVPDPFYYFDLGEKKYVFLDHRELEVFKKKNKNPQIEAVLLNPLIKEAMKINKNTDFSNKLALLLFEKYDLIGKKVEVPVNFPLDLADFLRENKVELKPVKNFYPNRTRKTDFEIKMIKQSLEGIYASYDRIKEVLKESQIKDDKIIFRKKALTSEILKLEVDKILLKHDMSNVTGIIIASGEDTATPHNMGEGEIKPHSPIICDIFPQNRTSRYFADMTRTFVKKGKASKKLKAIYEAVLESHKAGIQAVKPGIKGLEVHKVCANVLLEKGFHVGDKGFIHGTGHGLGIDVHESPYLNDIHEDILEPGNVVTVEPGLYYPGIGGVRIEDDILVTKDGHENLTNYPKDDFVIE